MSMTFGRGSIRYDEAIQLHRLWLTNNEAGSCDHQGHDLLTETGPQGATGDVVCSNCHEAWYRDS